MEYYNSKDTTKTAEDIDKIYKKCVDQVKDDNPQKICVGGVATNLVKRLKKKYHGGDGVLKLEKRFELEELVSLAESKSDDDTGQQQKPTQSTGSSRSSGNRSDQPNLHVATKEELLTKIEK